jgi:hypothetical protein
MKKTMLQVVMLLALGCMKKLEHGFDPDPTDALTARALLNYALPVDGCDWSLQIANQLYVPSAATLPKVKAVGEFRYGVVQDSVTLRYRLTGRNVELQCGWGHKSVQAEIEVLEVKK